jgi:DNA repair exonuclease SbcCD ATPase subunit
VILFTELSWRNFLSTGNHKNTLDLTRHNTTLVSGENGAGKSTMLDALTFSLFGKSFRGINIPQLPNSINDKNCEVEIEFTIGKDEYRVFRSLKPKKFEIYKNDNLLPQNSKSKDYQKILEEQILKMSYNAFCQVVILGSSNYIPFMQLTAADRRSVVENLLDIDVFSIMNILVKARLQITKEYIKDVDHKIELIKSKVEEKEKTIKTLLKKSSTSIESYKKDIEETQNKIQETNHDITKIQSNVDGLLKQVTDKDSVPKTLLKMESLEQQLKSKIKTIEKSVKFYEENDTCPSCKQDIQDHHKRCMVKEKAEERAEIEKGIDELLEKIDHHEKRSNDINTILDTVQKIEKKIIIRQSEVSASNQYIAKVQKQLDSVQNEGDDVQETKDEMNQLIGEGKQHAEKRKELIEDRHYYEIANSLLKDSGIKAKIIKHYLPVMNKLINKNLKSMDFFCQFNLDENFNETIKSRHRDEFTYYSFSEGERLRIDLSLLLAWREIARMKNSVNCNLLILDEVFDSSLDGVGTEEFLKLLTTFGSRANIFVISHKSDSMTDKFQNHIVFEKKNNFSRIK